MKPRTLSRIVIITVVALCIVAAAIATTVPRGGSSVEPPQMVGTSLFKRPAPDFALRDQNGKMVTLKGQRGSLVVLTFFYTHCPDTCPLTAQKLRAILRQMGSESRRVRVIVVSTDPLHDTPASAYAFLKKNGRQNWKWLLGGYHQLKPVWHKYGIFVPSKQAAKLNGPSHSASTYLIDPAGREREVIDDTTPAPQIANDIHLVLDDHKWQPNTVAPRVGAQAPPFSLHSLSGTRISLSARTGQPTIVNFWATFCGPCKQELPALEHTYRQHNGNLRVVGIDGEEEATNDVRSFARKAGVTYPIAIDNDGTAVNRYQLSGIPTTFFVDRHGVIRHISLGPLTLGELKTWANQIMK